MARAAPSMSSVVACMAYVDAKPFRAGVGERPEQGEWTSLWARTHAEHLSTSRSANHGDPWHDPLLAQAALARHLTPLAQRKNGHTCLYLLPNPTGLMVVPRSWIAPDSTRGTFHVISRCPRRQWLLHGEHAHRKAWICALMAELLEVFQVDLHAWARSVG